jgi:hypothetical protein
MRGPEFPTVLIKASDRFSRTRIWNAVHPDGDVALMEREDDDARESLETLDAPSMSITLGLRGTPVAAPRRSR